MGEPRLEDIEDYDNLKGEKKKVVWSIVFATILIGIVYTIANSMYGSNDDAMSVKESIKTMPLR